MTTIVMVNGHAAEPGCYIVGHWGQYGPDRVADVAESFGWESGRHVRDDPRRLRRVAKWLDERTPTEPFCKHCRRPLEYDREWQVWVALADDRAVCPKSGEDHEPTWRAANVWEFHIEAADDIVTWLNDHTAPMCPHCGGAMYVTSDGFYRHVAFPSEAARQEAGGPCAYSAIDSPIHPVWEWYDGEFCLSLYDGESDEPLEPGDSVCKNCGLAVFFDVVDGLWRHSESEGEGCGSHAPNGDDSTSAEPAS